MVPEDVEDPKTIEWSIETTTTTTRSTGSKKTRQFNQTSNCHLFKEIQSESKLIN